MPNEDEKKVLIEKGIHAGLGTEKFLEGVSLENLKVMIQAVEDRDGKIEVLKKTQKPEEKKQNITTVQDLVIKGRIKVRPVDGELEEENKIKLKKKAGKDDAKDET